ncbi:MAG: ubiquitin-like domain-containing protein [Chloroflexota bacterium]
MTLNRWLALLFAFLFISCQPTTPSTVIIIDNDQVISLQTDKRVPAALLAQAGITLNANDRILVNGLPVDPNQPVGTYPITVQTRRAISLTLVSPDGKQQVLQSAAFTVGEVLDEVPAWLRAGIEVDPPVNTPVSSLQLSNSPITITPSRAFAITSNGKSIQINSSARTVGEALAEAGIPLLGLDYSLPAENEALPSDGQIRVTRVSESVVLAQKPIPFESDLQASAEVPLDQTQIIQPGETGLTVQRIRIRYEDGNEISRVTENEMVVRPPKMRILGYGTKVEIKTAMVDGVEIEYWRALQMYATSYSPCRSGSDRCYTGTSSGKSLKKGMVGMRYSWYLAMGGQPLFIPGYGYATVEDVCGGCTGKPWIDLGYSDSDWQQWSSWVTVYFLTPVPPNVIHVLE